VLVLDRHDLTDVEWARLEPLLPDRVPRRGRAVGRSSDGAERGVLADAVWVAVAGSAAQVRALEDRL
jgi:transposase